MSNHGSTIRRRTLRVALIGGAVALISSLVVGHAFAVGPVTVTNPMPPVATNLTTFGTADVARGITSV